MVGQKVSFRSQERSPVIAAKAENDEERTGISTVTDELGVSLHNWGRYDRNLEPRLRSRSKWTDNSGQMEENEG
jgi:hypothetical protein